MNLKENTQYKACFKRLSDENMSIGFCDECAVKEVVKLKRRIIISFIVSGLIIASAFLICSYVCRASYVGDYGEVIVPTVFGRFLFNMKTFQRIFSPSKVNAILYIAICFFCAVQFICAD